MYLRTPKRYRPGRRRHLRLISRRAVLSLLLIAVLVWVGWIIWVNQARVRSSVVPQIESLAEGVQTQIAPRPTPTVTPDLVVAQAGCTGAYQQGDLEEAIQQCAVLADNNPNDVDLHYRVAHLMIITSSFGNNADRLNQALEYADKTINANPEAPHGWAVKAMALDWSGDYGRALASALHAKALDESFAPTYAFLGEIYQDLQQFDTAATYLEQAIELDTSGLAIADAFRNQGLLYSSQGDYENAIRPYQIALERAPNHTYIAIELANNYIALEEIDAAMAILTASLERNPKDPMLLFALGNAAFRNGNRDRAYEYYRRCLDTDPDNRSCLSYLGGLQYFDGDYATAVVTLDRAIQMGSTDPDDFLQIGGAYTQMSRCDQAVSYLQKGYQLTVENEDFNRQASFANALQACGVLITQSTPGADLTPSVPEAAFTPTP